MPNYENTKIYKLWTHANEDIYIGSTTRSLSQRLAKHKSDSKQTTKKPCCSSGILFKNECKVMIELMEEFSCENKMMACKREGELIRSNSCINKNIPGRTQKEWQETHKEHIKEQRKEPKKLYYLANKERRNEYQRQYNIDNKEKRKEYQREYYLKSKESKNVESLGENEI